HLHVKLGLFTLFRAPYRGNIMWIITARLRPARRQPCSASTVRPLLESLEDRCLPSVMSPTASTSPAAVNTIASLPHDQIHVLQDQSQQQTAMATLRLEVEEIVLGLLQEFAPQAPQFQPLIASLTADIPMQQATVQILQMQTDLLNQLDDLQDQS